MEQDVEALYAHAVTLATQSRDGSCEWLQRSLMIDWTMARHLHARLIAESVYLKCRRDEIKPPLAGRRCVRLMGAGRAGNITLQHLNADLPRETVAGFELDIEGHLYLVDEYGHSIGRVPNSDGRGQRVALFEALSRSTRIVMLVGDPRDFDAAILLPMLAQGVKRAGAWVVWLDCRHVASLGGIAPALPDVSADIAFTASSFGVPGIDEGQVNVLAAHRILDMLMRTFGNDVPGSASCDAFSLFRRA